MERVYYHFKEWEDNQNGMYETTCFMDPYDMILDCKRLLTTKEWLWEAMTFVSHSWIKSSTQQLTNINRNRQAWLGQAACCFSHGAPEYLTKRAWALLDENQQKIANEIADQVICDWEQKFKSGYFNGKKISGLKCI